MTLRRQLSLIMFSLILVTVLVNSLISTRYIDRYFRNYVSDAYEKNIGDITTFSENLLIEGVSNRMMAQRELNNFVDDPIVSISIYDASGNLVAFAEEAMHNMHKGMMMGGMYDAEKDIVALKRGGQQIGELVIARTGDIQSTETVRLFKRAMIIGSGISGLVVLFIALFLVGYSGKRITKDLRDTARYARSIELGQTEPVKRSNILEVRGLQISLENLSNKLKLQKAARKQKTDQLAHETRTPLTILRTHCEGALDGVIDMDKTRLESCINEIENLSQLISNMNEVIEYESKGTEIKRVQYDLAAELKKVMKGLNLQYKTKGLGLCYRGPEKFIIVNDPAMLNQAIYNLLTNAYKFTEKGKVIVTLNSDGGKWTLSVTDTGRGISEEDKAKIFDAYYRSHEAVSTEGDGLGLYISHSNIERLGGHIDVTSKQGEGSCFTVSFKVKKQDGYGG